MTSKTVWSESASRPHLDVLTSLRFFAAIWVVLFHAGGPTLRASGHLPTPISNILANGYLGVPFFFILSGFVLTYTYGHTNSLRTKRGLLRFALARFARIYPVFFLSLILMVPFVRVDDLFHAAPQFLLLQSWLPLTLSTGEFLANWNMEAWTLSLEVFFYLLFPALLLIALRLTTRGLVVLIGLCITLMVVFRLPEIRTGDNLIQSSLAFIPLPLLRLPEFCYGISLSLLVFRLPSSFQRPIFGLACISVILLVSTTSSLWVAPPVAILSGIVIALAPACLTRGWAAGILKHRWLVILGGASYAIYILQLPIRLILKGIVPSPYDGFVYLPSLVLISVLVHLWFEEPARRHINGRGLKITRPNWRTA
ncbi:MAG: acyltransferase [Pseudomonadota bacterium]